MLVILHACDTDVHCVASDGHFHALKYFKAASVKITFLVKDDVHVLLLRQWKQK